MNILVIGCGRIGSSLAEELDKRGHDVSVIDQNPEKLEMLSADFSGFTTIGIPIDLDVLKRAGVTTCDVLYAVTDKDDINIMVSQIAHKTFKIGKIFARVADIRKGEVFEKLGINVLCPTRLTVNAACEAISENASDDK